MSTLCLRVGLIKDYLSSISEAKFHFSPIIYGKLWFNTTEKRTITLIINLACVHGSTNGTNGIQISFKVLPMVPLVIPLVPIVNFIARPYFSVFRS